MTCTIIDFPENFHPARLLIFQKIFPLHVYLGLFCPARLMFSKNFPTCTFISSYTSIRYTRVSDQFGTIQNLQRSPITQTSTLLGTFFWTYGIMNRL